MREQCNYIIVTNDLCKNLSFTELSCIELTSVSRLHFCGRYHHSKTISSCKVALRGYEPEYETTLNKYSGGICHQSEDGWALETPA